ncbi:MAG: hypothetical protein AAGB97_09570 [Dehalococcoidia bacterium]
MTEYWLVDPDEKRIEVYILRGSVYELAERFKPGEVACSVLRSGFEVSVDEVFRR